MKGRQPLANAVDLDAQSRIHAMKSGPRDPSVLFSSDLLAALPNAPSTAKGLKAGFKAAEFLAAGKSLSFYGKLTDTVWDDAPGGKEAVAESEILPTMEYWHHDKRVVEMTADRLLPEIELYIDSVGDQRGYFENGAFH